MKNVNRSYKIGSSCKYGNVIAVNENMTDVTKDEFYSAIDSSLKQWELQRHEKEAKMIKNLKNGVTIGDNFFIIEDSRKIKI